MVARLVGNWYETALDLASMTKEEADDLCVPIRLWRQVQKLLQEQGQGGGAPAPPTAASAAAAEAEAEALGPHASPGVTPLLAASVALRAAAPRPGPGEQASASTSAPALPTQQQQQGADGSWDPELDPDIMRRTLPRVRHGQGQGSLIKTTTRTRQVAYSLRADQTNVALAAEMDDFVRFCTTRFFGQQSDPIAPRTAENYTHWLLCFLGWMHHHRGVPLDDLTLKRLLPSSDRQGVVHAFDCLQFLAGERNLAVSSQLLVLNAFMQAAKFLYHSESKSNVRQGDKAYADVVIVQELRGMMRDLGKEAKVAPPATDIAAKWLDWPEFLKTVRLLRAECAGLDGQGRPRGADKVAMSLQRYLMFAILACVPDRQRTLRELVVGKTLVKDAAGRWVIRHGPKDYKTGRHYGERPPLVITTADVEPELSTYLSTFRASLNPTHNCLFSRANGTPFDDQSLGRMFQLAAFRLTGKRTTPHLVRDMIVTHLRGGDASEKELEALAIYMGHSIAMQRESYDRRTKAQKVEPAVEMLQALNARAGARAPPSAAATTAASPSPSPSPSPRASASPKPVGWR
ncbi:hypothetical protein FOA52_003818 [Chlamydomonas sp. UWO 241]|nr:hypothetical protein FOA52_003818 [Chlamydomonas sp. UWO 241]